MGRGPIPRRPHGGFPVPHLCAGPRIRHYHMFPCAIPDRGAGYPRVTHPSAASVPPEGGPFARLACLRRAASVRSEPGSNSPSWSPRATRRGAIFQIVILSPSIPRTWLDLFLLFTVFRIDREARTASLLMASLSLRSSFKKHRRFPAAL